MLSDYGSMRDALVAPKARRHSSVTEDQPPRRAYLRLIFLVLALNLISATLFIGLINRPVYDDKYNLFDVHQYATKGFSRVTLLAHRNPPGPGSFLWMAAAVRLLGGEELRDARIGSLLSWVLLALGVLVGARYSRFPQIWYGALLTLLLFPHTLEATATALTEGPALLFAVLGALAWTEFVSRAQVTTSNLLLGLAGAVSLGVAVTCRQYNLALLPAAGVLALYPLWRNEKRTDQRSLWLVCVFVLLVIAVLPVLFLIMVWRGLSSPGMATGTSYNMMWKAGVGMNLHRPMIAAFYSAFYILLLTFPLMLRMKPGVRWRALLAALFVGIAAASFSSELLQPGPLHTLVRAVSRVPFGGIVFFGLIAGVTVYNTVGLGLRLWEQRAEVLSSPPLMFALLTTVFFIGEQLGVGGNIPLYDRYFLQLAPFLGLIAFSLLPRLDRARLFVLLALLVVSQVMLWRYAFIT